MKELEENMKKEVIHSEKDITTVCILSHIYNYFLYGFLVFTFQEWTTTPSTAEQDIN